MVHMDTLRHTYAREIGAENIAYQTWVKLDLTGLLLSAGFTQEQAVLAATQVVNRAVYPASELKTVRWIKEGGVKNPDKVHQRIGRAKQKYPSVQHYYDIALDVDEKTGLAAEITWKKDTGKDLEKTENLGVCFLRTNLNVREEYVVWNIYNTIKEIENAFRTLKTDLDLRPVYHKNDDATMAHLHLGILAYWLVNTVRHQLKHNGVKSCWGEIVRIGNTQKVITTSGTNTYDKTVAIRKCTVPNDNLKRIYDILQTKHQPFTKRKSVVHKLEIKKIKPPDKQLLLSG